MKRILGSYRRKILAVYPGARFDYDYMLGITVEQWADQIEAQLDPGMGLEWENYGTMWVVGNKRKKSDVNMADPKQFYDYFKAKEFWVMPLEDSLPWIQRLVGYNKKNPVNFVAPGLPPAFGEGADPSSDSTRED